MKLISTIVALLIAFVIAVGSASAFHQAGVANCNGCHTMHNSQDSGPTNPGSPDMLLLEANTTDLCLSCHATNHGSVMGPSPTSPPPERGAGNFVYLLEDNINDSPDGATNPIAGHAAGHNVVSAAYGIMSDPIHATAPGGSYPASSLTCTSCHDPHGNQNFRMLRGQGGEQRTGFLFAFDAPVALGVDLTMGTETQTNHTAYQSGWSHWCSNCHGFYHQGHAGQGFEHPVNRNLGGDVRDSYNSYNGAANPIGGAFETAYLPDVPIQDMSMTVATTSGATTTSRITCMTCHRAHATSAPKATRWDPNVEFLGSDGFQSGSYAIPNPYPEPAQRPLCVKCHYQESTEHGQGQACMDCHRSIE